MSKIDSLVNDVLEVVESYGANTIKTALKDSTNNNRVVSVNQVIRFLKTRKNPAYRTLAGKLNTVYTRSIRGTALTLREVVGSNRTDSIDLNEFVFAVEYRKTIDTNFSRSVANVL